jgi:NADPH2:quinone reductase
LATAGTEEKRTLCLTHGAEAAFDSHDADGLTKRVREATGGRGCDVVVDGVGGPLFMPSLRALAPCGRYVVVGSASQSPAMFDARHLLPRSQTVCGFILHHVAEQDPAEPTRSLQHLCDLVRSGSVRPQYETVPLNQAPEIHRAIEERTLVGKVVLVP